MKRYRTIFQVSGQQRFPIDMLRYECCYPARGEDASAIEATFADLPSCGLVRDRVIHLAKYHDTKAVHIETARWGSFGWVVLGKEAPVKL